jgi:hypothetical protein
LFNEDVEFKKKTVELVEDKYEVNWDDEEEEVEEEDGGNK